MDKPRQRVLSILDFVRWSERDELMLSPKFQRRDMWPPKARSYLIDTILRGFPIPKLYMRQHLDIGKARTIHEVVDGQQRIRAVLDFYAGRFRISKSHGPFAGDNYQSLDETAQRGFLGYEFSVDLLVGATDADVLDIFARINSYSAPLNGQEKRNAKFFGAFKQTVYQLAYEHLEFWKQHSILTDKAIARMREAELTSELLISMVVGLQDKKTKIDDYYKKWDDSFPRATTRVNQFRSTVDLINELVGQELRNTVFHRPTLFYSLFMAFYAIRFGIGDEKPRRGLLSPSRAPHVRRVLAELTKAVNSPSRTRRFAAFVDATQRQTDNVGPRRVRHNTIVRLLSE